MAARSIAQTEKDGFVLKRNIYLMYAIACLQGMVFYGPIATLYRQAAGVNIFQITLIESIALALMVLLELPWGIVADKIGYRRTMIFCCGLYFVSKLVFWRADGFAGFLLERILLSVVCAGLSGVDTSVLYLSCEPGESQRVFGVYQNLGMAGLLAAAAVYSLAVGDDYRLAGLLTAVTYGAAAVLALGLREVRRPEEARTQPARAFFSLLRQLLRDRRLLRLLLATALLNETHQTITVFLNQLQYVRAGMSARAIAAVYLAVTLAGLCGGWSARLTGRLGPRKTGAGLYVLCCGACVALALTRSAVLSVGAVLLLRIGFSLYQPLQTELQNRAVVTANRATALSLNAVLMDGAAIAANLAFGAVAQRNLSASMLLGGALCAAGLVLYLLSQGAGPRRFAPAEAPA